MEAAAVSVLQEDPDLHWNVKLESGLLVCASAENPTLYSDQKLYCTGISFNFFRNRLSSLFCSSIKTTFIAGSAF